MFADLVVEPRIRGDDRILLLNGQGEIEAVVGRVARSLPDEGANYLLAHVANRKLGHADAFIEVSALQPIMSLDVVSSRPSQPPSPAA